jgi:hypothetical protein
MINRIDETLNTMTLNSDITHEQINGIVSDLGDLFINKATVVFGYSSGKNKSNDPRHKSWFTKTCREKRDTFHAAKDKYSRDKSREVKDLLNLRAKEYKKEMKVSYRRY